MVGRDNSHPRQMVDIQHNTTIMGIREVSRPYRVGFSPKASGFYPFGDAAALSGEGGVGDVVWLIQASASSHKPKPSLWFAKIISLTAIICQPHLLTLQNNLD